MPLRTMAPGDELSMSIHDDFVAELKDAMKAGDKARVNVIRQIETEVSTIKTRPDFTGEVDDDLYLSTIAGYVKKMDKARKEFEAAGDRGAERAASLAYEVEYLSRWLPTKLGAAAARAASTRGASRSRRNRSWPSRRASRRSGWHGPCPVPLPGRP